jgi:hypothetical protein
VHGGGAGLPLAVTTVEDHGRFRIVSAVLDDRPVAPRGALPPVSLRSIKLRLGPAAADEANPPVVGQILRVEFPPDRICLYRDGRIVAPAAPAAPAPGEPSEGAA